MGGVYGSRHPQKDRDDLNSTLVLLFQLLLEALVLCDCIAELLAYIRVPTVFELH